MNSDHKILTLEIPASHYEQLVGIAALLESVNGTPADANAVAAKLLLRALTALNGSNSMKSETKQAQVETVTKPVTENGEVKTADEIVQVFAPDANDTSLAALPEVAAPKLIEGLSEPWRKCLGNVEQGARIAIVSNESAFASVFALCLAQELTQSGSALYVAPNLVGHFPELLEKFGLKKAETPHRAKAIHYLPETRTEWRRVLIGSGNKVQYSAAVFDNASEMQLSADFPHWLEQLEIGGEPSCITQVFTFTIDIEKQPDEDFSDWMDQLEIVLYVEKDKKVTTIKNVFREAE